jgi:PKD repeat protein
MSTRRTLARILPRPIGVWIQIGFVLTLVGLASAGCRQQNGNDTPGNTMNTPVASFSHGMAAGTPGLAVQFQDTSSGSITSRSWNFGNGQSSTEASPLVVFADPGLYTVSLTVEGSRGTSTMTQANLVQVDVVPTAGFACSVTTEFAPVTTTCMNSGTAPGLTTSYHWDFGDGTTSNLENPTHTYSTPGDYSVTQTITTAAGSATAVSTISALPLTLTVTPLTGGGGPGLFRLSADTGPIPGVLAAWSVNGVFIGFGKDLETQLNTPGDVTLSFTFGSFTPPLSVTRILQYTVAYGPPVADFMPSVSEGSGPLSVVLEDRSQGEITQWEWDFGDGSRCDFPELVGAAELCNAASPTHLYDAIGIYQASLRVTGSAANPGDPELVDVVDETRPVRVTIMDPSFENQIAGAEIAESWTALRPASATESAQHIALSSAGAMNPDAGMPSDGDKWAALDGRGTDGSTPPLQTDNGIRTNFIKPLTASVLEFDYVLLYSEPTLAGTLDGMTATVSDGSTTVEIPSARADVHTPYAGTSSRFPTLGGSLTRSTPLQTAGLDLDAAFPGAPPETVYTLTIRLANASNSLRSPRAYVDAIRFSEPTDPIVAAFALDTNPVVAGLPTQFTDETCPDPETSGCTEPTSFRWDFDTHFFATPPSASGSGEQDPSYVFPEAGSYDVVLTARSGAEESSATMTIDVIEGPAASFTASFLGTTQAPNAIVRFEDASTSDPSDPIVAWSWDFVVAQASTRGPHDVQFLQAGSYPIELTVTTASGLSHAEIVTVTID